MKSKLRAAITAAGCALALSVGAAKADIITTFDVSATFTTCPGCTLSGTIAIDVTNGSVQSANIILTGLPLGPFTQFAGPFAISGSVIEILVFGPNGAGGDRARLDFQVPNLVGYSGGPICSFLQHSDCNSDAESSTTGGYFIASGSLSPEISAVPGPIAGAGLPGLMALGMFGLNHYRRRRNNGGLPA